MTGVIDKVTLVSIASTMLKNKYTQIIIYNLLDTESIYYFLFGSDFKYTSNEQINIELLFFSETQ